MTENEKNQLRISILTDLEDAFKDFAKSSQKIIELFDEFDQNCEQLDNETKDKIHQFIIIMKPMLEDVKKLEDVQLC